MPVASAANAAAAATDTGAGQFATVLQQRTAAHEDDAATSSRLDVRGKFRKSDERADAGQHVAGTGVNAVAGTPMPGTPMPVTATTATSTAEPAAANEVASAVSLPAMDVAPRMGTASVAASGADAATRNANEAATDGAEAGTEAGGKVEADTGTGAARAEKPGAEGATRSETPGAAAQVANLVSPFQAEAIEQVALSVPGSLAEVSGASALPGASASRQGSAANGAASRNSGMDRSSALAEAKFSPLRGGAMAGLVPGSAAGSVPGSAAGTQAGEAGENGRGQHESKGAGRTGEKIGAEGTGSTVRGDAASEATGGTVVPTVSVSAGSAPAAAAVAQMTAAPVQAPASGSATAGSLTAGGTGAAGSAATGAVRTVGADAAAGETAPLTSVGAARLLKTAAGSELRVGTQSADLGAVTIRTVLGRDQMQAHISFSNERMGPALSSHLQSLGGSLEDRLGQSLGVRASVSVSTGADTEHSGRDASQDAMAGQAGSGSRDGSRDGSGRQTAETAGLPGLSNGSSIAGSSVSRSIPYGGTTAVEGRLDIRV